MSESDPVEKIETTGEVDEESFDEDFYLGIADNPFSLIKQEKMENIEFLCDVPRIGGLYYRKRLPKEDVYFSIQWYALQPEKKMILNTDGTYKPKEASERQKSLNLKEPDVFQISFNLNNTTRRLPPGDYRVEVHLNSKFVASLKRLGIYIGTSFDNFGIVNPSETIDANSKDIFAFYSLGRIVTEVKSTKGEWYELEKKKEEEEEEEEEEQEYEKKLIHTQPVEVKGAFDTFKLKLPRLDRYYKAGRYEVVFYMDGVELGRKQFTISPPTPTLTLGTKVDRYGNVLGASMRFKGSQPVIFGVYKFFRMISRERVGKVRYLHCNNPFTTDKEKTMDVEPKFVAESIIRSPKDYDTFAFQFGNAPQQNREPGAYKVQILLDEDIVAEKFFMLAPRYTFSFGEIDKDTFKIRDQEIKFKEGLKKIDGLLDTNITIPNNETISFMLHCEQLKNKEYPPLHCMCHCSIKMSEPFKKIGFSFNFDKPFPVGKYRVKMCTGKLEVCASQFEVLDELDYRKFVEQRDRMERIRRNILLQQQGINLDELN